MFFAVDRRQRWIQEARRRFQDFGDLDGKLKHKIQRGTVFAFIIVAVYALVNVLLFACVAHKDPVAALDFNARDSDQCVSSGFDSVM